MYLGFCSEYCYLIKDVKVIGNYPVLERKCNWCHGTYEYRYGDNRKDSFCGLGCSQEAQGIRKYYAIINILRVFKNGLSAKEIAKHGEQHGCPMNFHKASMRCRTLKTLDLITLEEQQPDGWKQNRYYLNPDIRDLPFKESLKVLDKFRKTRRRDKLRQKRAKNPNYCR
jgi:hypothetical protein